MSITDELREYADKLNERAARESEHGFSPAGRRLEHMADRIDAEHEREVDAARETVFSMPNHRVALPLDADGVPIHLGDELCPVDTPECHSPVEFMTLTETRWMVDGECDPSELRHWEALTIEDVLRDVVTLCHNTWKEEKSALKFYDVDDVMNSGNIADAADRIREAVAHEEDK